MSRDRLGLTVLLAILILVKLWTAIEDQPFQLLLIPAALMGVGIFGSPQIFWLLHFRTIENKAQARIAFAVIISFAIAYAYFGFFPGQSPPRWGTSAHFEVPIALVVEWAIAVLFFFPFRSFGTEKNDTF